jgi:hypothetical protein
MPTDRIGTVREKLPAVRASWVRRFSLIYFEDIVSEDGAVLAEHARRELKFYIQPSIYEDGRLGEIFISTNKQGGLISGALNVMAIMISIGLQHGVPLLMITEKLRGQNFGPSGWTGDKEFPNCTSLFDLVAQYLDAKFPNGVFIGTAPKTEQAQATG